MNIDYDNLERDINDGTFRQTPPGRADRSASARSRQAGERLPLASHYAAQIAEIINRDADLSETLKFELYQEILQAVERRA